MQLVQGLAVLFTSAIGVADAQTPTAYACPAVGSSTAIPTSETTIRIPVVSNANELCTLVRHTIATGLQRVPVTRSYATRDWEVSAGLYSNIDQSGLAVDCAPADGTPGVCDITLPTSPTLEVGTQEYILESFERSLSSEATAARFLEQSTFGSTRSDIDALVASGNDFESWLSNQMYSIPASTMREFYRKRVNPKYENSYVFGAVGSGPCEKYSRWRTYAVSPLTYCLCPICMYVFLSFSFAYIYHYMQYLIHMKNKQDLNQRYARRSSSTYTQIPYNRSSLKCSPRSCGIYMESQ